MSYTNTPRFLLHQFYELYLGVNPNDKEKKIELDEKYDDWVAQDVRKRAHSIVSFNYSYMEEGIQNYCENLYYDKSYLNPDIVAIALKSFSDEDIISMLELAAEDIDIEPDFGFIVTEYIDDKVKNLHTLAADYLANND